MDLYSFMDEKSKVRTAIGFYIGHKAITQGIAWTPEH